MEDSLGPMFCHSGFHYKSLFITEFHHCPQLLHLWAYVSSHCGIESYLGVKKSLDLIASLVPRIVGIDVQELSLWELFGMNSTCLKNELLQKHGGGDGGGGGGAGGRGPRIFKH